MITSAQCRAARALLDWSQQQLADAAAIGVVTVRQLEAGASQPRSATLVVLTRALEAAGVEFIAENGGGAGVRLAKRASEPKQGPVDAPLVRVGRTMKAASAKRSKD